MPRRPRRRARRPHASSHGIEDGRAHERRGQDDQCRRQESDAGELSVTGTQLDHRGDRERDDDRPGGAATPPPRPRRHTAEQVADRPVRSPRMATSASDECGHESQERRGVRPRRVVTDNGPGEPSVARANSQIPTCPAA